MEKPLVFAFRALALWCATALGAAWGQVPPLSDADASCEYFAASARLAWRHRGGDWRDAAGQAQGKVPFAEAFVPDIDQSQVVSWDVTRLVQAWLERGGDNEGFLIRPVAGKASGLVVFHSKEVPAPKLRPVLQLQFVDGGSDFLFPAADTFLVCSTVSALGHENFLKAGPDEALAIRFALPARLKERRLAQARLQLVSTNVQYGDAALGIYRLDPPGGEDPGLPRQGLAASYPGDRGIGASREVIMATGFEQPDWPSDWSYTGPEKTFEVLSRADGFGFVPLHGKALRVVIPKDRTTGLNMRFNFREKLGYEPEEVYFRYYLRFADDWHPTVDGGKLPGLAGTYDTGKTGGGWGGNRSDGTNGWSMRGSFLRESVSASALGAPVVLGNYAYHVDMQDFYGEFWPWSRAGLGHLQRNRWYCIEQYVKMNTLGQPDGVLRVWVDGMLAFEKSDIRYRTTAALKIEKVWMNVYHGGTAPPGRDLHLYIDNVVIARRYIGPLPAPREGASRPQPSVRLKDE